MKQIKKDHKKSKIILNNQPNKPYKIFLDDERSPQTVFDKENSEAWIICRSSKEAIKVVESYGYMPEHIAFDHDLGEADTAIKFILWLVNANLDERIKGSVPNYSVHSDNPAGRNNIESKMNSWKKISQL